MWVCDQDGNWYLLIEIEQEGGGDDYFAFHEGYGIPPAGAELTVSCSGNISCWEPKFDDLTGGEVKSGPEAVNDAIAITEDESIGDAGDDAQLNILANDSNATLAAVGGLAPGEDLLITTDNGVDIVVTVDAEGNLSFDTNGQFEGLNDGESDSFTLSYTVTGADGGTADATVTVVINGVTDAANAIDDCFIVFESKTGGEHGGEGNVLANDDLDPANSAVIEVNGEQADAGRWVDLASGAQFRLNANGEFDFNANGAHDDLTSAEKAFETLTYTVQSSNADDDVITTTFHGPNGLQAEVVIDEVGGDLVVSIEVLEGGGDIGDIRGLFFDVPDESLLSGLDAVGTDVTRDKFYADGVYNLGHGANIKGSVLKQYGKFDGGVKIWDVGHR